MAHKKGDVKADKKLAIQGPGLGLDLIFGYYKERYEETRAAYRRLEDKLNNLLTILGIEISALLAVFSFIDFDSKKGMPVSFKFFLLCLMINISLIIVSFFFLWKSWELKPLPRMPTHKKEEEIEFLLRGNTLDIARYHMLIYAEAVDEIDGFHREKAAHVVALFKGVAFSLLFFIGAVISLFINKV